MIYLASPYSHPDPAMRERRYRAACAACAKLMRRGLVVFSPIVHSHVLATEYGISGDWETWQRLDEELIAHSETVIVLRLDGWQASRGVTAEIDHAAILGVPVEHVTPLYLGVDPCGVAGQ